jgi:ureidoacrylate peracid hydrolase
MNRRYFLGSGIATTAAAWIDLEIASPEMTGAQRPDRSKLVVKLDAKPAPIELDLARTAVLVVDMQNDFCSKGGDLDREGIDLSIVQRVIPPTQTALFAARKAGLKIIYTKMGFQPDLSDIGVRGSRNSINNSDVGSAVKAPNGAPSRVLVRDTWNTDIITELKPQPGDTVIYKNRFSAFYQTELDAVLKRSGTRSLVVVGCTTSVCVESTIRDASFRDYSVVLLADCTAEPEGYGLPRTNYEATLLLVEDLFGWTSTSEQFAKAVA